MFSKLGNFFLIYSFKISNFQFEKLKDEFIYLKDSYRARGREFLHNLFIPHVDKITSLGQAKYQSLKLYPSLPHCWPGPKHVIDLSLPSQDSRLDAGSIMDQPGLEFLPTYDDNLTDTV